MSHVTTVNLKVSNLEALKTAAERLGAEFREGQKSFQTWFEKQPCAHAIRVPGSKFEVGVMNAVNGTYDLRYDRDGDGRKIVQMFGQDDYRLRQEYSAVVTEDNAKDLARKGYRMTRETLDSGIVRMRFRQ